MPCCAVLCCAVPSLSYIPGTRYHIEVPGTRVCTFIESAAHRSAARRRAVLCCAVPCPAVRCCAVLCRDVLCFLVYIPGTRYQPDTCTYVHRITEHTQLSSAQRSAAAQRSTGPCGAVSCPSVLCRAVPCCAVLYISYISKEVCTYMHAASGLFTWNMDILAFRKSRVFT